MAQEVTTPALRLMLEATRWRQARHSARWTIGIAGLGLLNLFLCAFLERFLGDAAVPDGSMIFLAVESFFLLLTGAAVVNGELESMLRKTRLLPLTRSTRFGFIVLSLMQHRATLMIAATGVFAAAIIGPGAARAVAGRVIMTILLEVFLFSVMSMLTVLRVRPGAGERSLTAIAGLALGVVVILAAVITPGPILHMMLPLRWAADGMLMVHDGRSFAALLNASYLLMSTVMCMLIGRRYA